MWSKQKWGFTERPEWWPKSGWKPSQKSQQQTKHWHTLLEMPQSGVRPGVSVAAAAFWLLQEQLCCRSRKGRCITSSPLFSTLVVSRSVLETALFYVDPLAELREEAQLRHGAYAQFIRWRFGDSTPRDAVPVIPSCCIWRIRAEYPSPDGKYSGLRLYQAVQSQTDFNR